MREVMRKSLLTAVAAGGVLAATGGLAYADAGAQATAAGSPGVGSGNAVQLPVHVPVNLCGDTVDVLALLNPAFGGRCADDSGTPTPTPVASTPAHNPGGPIRPVRPGRPGRPSEPCPPGGPGTPSTPGTPSSPGTPGAPSTPGTPAPGDTDTSAPSEPSSAPSSAPESTPAGQDVAQPVATGELAHTGAGGTGLAAASAAGLLIGGTLMYRKATARR